MTFEEECWFADSLSDEKSIEHSIPVLNEALVKKNYLCKHKLEDCLERISNLPKFKGWEVAQNIINEIIFEMGL